MVPCIIALSGFALGVMVGTVAGHNLGAQAETTLLASAGVGFIALIVLWVMGEWGDL